MVETPGRVTLCGIEVFAAIAEERSPSAAARRLGASASAMSQQLSNLETALGAALVDDSLGVKPKAPGERLPVPAAWRSVIRGLGSERGGAWLP